MAQCYALEKNLAEKANLAGNWGVFCIVDECPHFKKRNIGGDEGQYLCPGFGYTAIEEGNLAKQQQNQPSNEPSYSRPPLRVVS